MKLDLFDRVLEATQEKKHIIWDWNGTLLDDVGHAVSVMNTLLLEHDLEVIDRERYRQIFDFPVLQYYQKLGFDFERESFEVLCHKFVDRFMAGFKDLPLIPEMNLVLTNLKMKNKTQSVLSATDQTNLDGMISHFGLSGVFQFIYGIDNKLAHSKVARGRDLIKNSGISASETLIIGDTLHDLEVAKDLGIEAILISHGHQCPTRLRPYHDMVIEA